MIILLYEYGGFGWRVYFRELLPLVSAWLERIKVGFASSIVHVGV